MNLEQRIDAFARLGSFLRQFLSQSFAGKNADCEGKFTEALSFQVKQAVHYNGWFTEENVLFALQTWGEELQKSKLLKWTSSYRLDAVKPRKVGVVTAGNIPLVGFHDFMSVLIAGHKIVIKQSSNDQKLLPVLASFLTCVAPAFKEFIRFTDTYFTEIDAVIATGSNNTARYFEHYFSKYAHIIRKSRNAVAVLTGKETAEELTLLGNDIFRYFGLGCRSVSKIFVPEAYNFDLFFQSIYNQQKVLQYQKYKNNYDYNKAVYLMSGEELIENGFLLLKKDTSYASPIATLFYEHYDSLAHLQNRLMLDKAQIQCIVASEQIKESIPFGTTQTPKLWDYADGVDTIQFLSDL